MAKPSAAAEPQILAEARSAGGVAFQLRRDPRGVLDVPGLESVLVSIHLGAPAKVTCRRGGRSFVGTAVHGDIDIIPAQTPARWEMMDGNDTALLLILPRNVLESAVCDTGRDPSRVEIRNRFQVRDPELETVCRAVQREMESGYRSGRLYLDGLALAAASRLLACHSSLAPAEGPRAEGLSGSRLKKVLAFIEEQLADDLSLDQIAGAAGLGTSHLKTQFRKAMGMPVHQYVIQRRVERARTLLMREELSMAAVAQGAGFAHQSHMARHMRRVLGYAPLEVKRLLGETAGD